MNTEIQKYIDSGLLEAYVTGSATPEEEREVLFYKQRYPEVKDALNQLELDMEAMAFAMAIPPPPTAWDRIETEIDDIILRERSEPTKFTEPEPKVAPEPDMPRYIDVQVQDSHMKIHKAWRWVFAAVFVLGKIFLGCAIYFYLENRQAKQTIMELKTEIKALK
ncbi:hypothetical protein [Mucilaginibacter myungsuensis]|uniref:Uncharacterized protein n=1 Tax=Mucilaginibacter myungsuensis TaxID=649104 RepID=A0A929KZT2_9SPHI|nr:hypothetical protein [Mucilaginibacter myungsuensis]MBE9663580.1 hypothetical protein [Mucilaginibacter myungsuensis]MDN3599096.1 hypothetical protein [Mucilaginibacter myungsuensis]